MHDGKRIATSGEPFEEITGVVGWNIDCSEPLRCVA
jgi:hypothetical protein